MKLVYKIEGDIVANFEKLPRFKLLLQFDWTPVTILLSKNVKNDPSELVF